MTTLCPRRTSNSMITTSLFEFTRIFPFSVTIFFTVKAFNSKEDKHNCITYQIFVNIYAIQEGVEEEADSEAVEEADSKEGAQEVASGEEAEGVVEGSEGVSVEVVSIEDFNNLAMYFGTTKQHNDLAVISNALIYICSLIGMHSIKYFQIRCGLNTKYIS